MIKYALEFIGGIVVIGIGMVITLYALVWGTALICAIVDHTHPAPPPRRMQPRCPKCDSAKVFGEPGHRVCTNCGAFQSEDLTWQ